jgi:hypothetical protein
MFGANRQADPDGDAADNQLFEINLPDTILRPGPANHKRETIVAPKRPPGSSERMVIFLTRRIGQQEPKYTY